MEHSYKITTCGRGLLAKCLDLGMPLEITRAAVGSGQVSEETSLADVWELIHYIADAAITGREHQGDRVYLTVQYSNQAHPETGDFTLSEIMVYARDPETGADVALLYAALGNYSQPVPPYTRGTPPGIWRYPMLLVVSGELQVNITASPGLVTSLDLQDAIDRLKLEIMTNELTLPLETADGEPLLTDGGTPILAVYHPDQSASVLTRVEALEEQLAGQAAKSLIYTDAQLRTASLRDRAYADGRVLALESRVEADSAAKVQAASEGLAGQIAAAKAEAVSAAGADAAAKVKAHSTDINAHPRFLAVSDDNNELPAYPPEPE